MELIISLDDARLVRYLKRSPRDEDIEFLYLGARKRGVDRLLADRGFKEVSLSAFGSGDREDFLREYVDLIGKLSRTHSSTKWWAGYLASKNRFASHLAFNLQLVSFVVRRIEGNTRCHTLLLINPPEEMCQSVEGYCLEHSIKLTVLRPWLWRATKAPRRFVLTLGGRLFFVGQHWRRVYLARRHLGKRLREHTRRDDRYYVLRSLFYPSSIGKDGRYQDSVFGVLPTHLVARGIKPLIVVQVMGEYKSCVRRIAEHHDTLLFPQELFLRYADPLRAVIDFCGRKPRIGLGIYFRGVDVSDIIQKETDRDFRSPGILSNYLQYFWMRRLSTALSIDTFAAICESNPWERMCTLALRQYSPRTMIVGYQHTVVPQASANMFVSDYERGVVPIPDRILTVGRVPREIMERYGCYEPGRVEEACALRYEYLFSIMPSPRTRSNRVLVALEGVPDVVHLVNYVVTHLGESREFHFTIRTHPVLPLRKISSELDQHLRSIPNGSISENTPLIRDTQQSDVVIYWGSTVGLEALMMGKPIIHFDMGHILSYDPLFECTHLKWVVDKNSDLVQVLKRIYDLSDAEFAQEYKLAREYLESYFYRVTEERLDKFVIEPVC